MATSTVSLQQLLRVALSQGSLRGLSAMVEFIARAAGAPGAVLWELVEDGTGAEVPSVLACWPDAPSGSGADPTTLAAFRARDLVLAPGPPTATERVVAALPVDYLDGCRGVLSLSGRAELRDEAFDVVADLLDVLPQLCTALRDRQTLTLVRDCTAVLNEADLSSPRAPLAREQLAAYFGQICTRIAADLRCRTVTLHLQEHESEVFPVFAASEGTSDAEAVRRGEGPAGLAIEQRHPRAVPLPGSTGGPLLTAPVFSGEHVWGVICCAGTEGAPYHFGQSDVSLLEPVGAMIANYWSSWLDRRAIAGENESWRRLAAGITEVNQLLAEQLCASPPRDELVQTAALEMVRDVVPDCTGSEIRRVDPRDTAGGPVLIARSGGDVEPAAPAGPVARTALRTSRRAVTVDQAEIAAEHLDGVAGWLVSTPIRVRDRRYGVLTAYGPGPAVPANSPQICEILADQLGLYQHLDSALRRLERVSQRLEETMRGQAEALEDLTHQLVSPLLTATGRTEHVLRTGRFDHRVEQQLRAVRGLCRKASRVALSAGVFATLSRGQKPTPKAEPIGSDELVRLLIAAADDAQVLSNPRHRIRFNVDRDSVRALGRQLVRSDRSFLEQSVGNLLDNAAKYSYQDTEVAIRGEVGEDRFAVKVINRGLPIRGDEVERCLERNWRGPAARNATGEGSGLGLWIVSNLMSAQRGNVDVAAVDDQTTVTLRLLLA